MSSKVFGGANNAYASSSAGNTYIEQERYRKMFMQLVLKYTNATKRMANHFARKYVQMYRRKPFAEETMLLALKAQLANGKFHSFERLLNWFCEEDYNKMCDYASRAVYDFFTEVLKSGYSLHDEEIAAFLEKLEEKYSMLDLLHRMKRWERLYEQEEYSTFGHEIIQVIESTEPKLTEIRRRLRGTSLFIF